MSTTVHTHISQSAKNRWFVGGFDKALLDESIVSLHFIAHPSDPNIPLPNPTNHWSSYLELATNKLVHLDVIPSGPDAGQGCICLSSREPSVTSDWSYKKTCLISNNVTLNGFLELIIKKNRDKYNFADGGEGCRFWLSVVLEDLVEAGIISREDGDETQVALPKYWSKPGTSTDRPMAVGTFWE
ncbi:hypothetical protein BDN72DRAFT_836648 [Pluteus cervinus]|uniref:Uncharacterized protein n=1 Tax=Pluteus cervinus TaxID=181527 RepID=A0ACD3B379_9AGAR|nr:hypothetical protein BDN72DRAFT_836648 [Pluteus cervinus]